MSAFEWTRWSVRRAGNGHKTQVESLQLSPGDNDVITTSAPENTNGCASPPGFSISRTSGPAGRLETGKGLPGEKGFVGAELVALDQNAVGWHAIAFVQKH